MTRPASMRIGDRISRTLVHSAWIVGAFYWGMSGQDSSSSAELAQAQERHGEIQTLRVERDLLRADVLAIRDQLARSERDRDLAREMLRTQRLGELELAMATTEVEDPPESVRSPRLSPKTPISIDKQQLEPLPAIQRVARVQATDSRSAPLEASIAQELSLNSDMALASKPGRVEFHGMKSGSSKVSIDDEDLIDIVELEPYHTQLARAHAEEVWYKTRVETSQEECRRHRGAARSRCEAEVDQALVPYGPHAVDCILTGNARPDYIQGVKSSAVPSHSVTLDHGALILCDVELSNR